MKFLVTWQFHQGKLHETLSLFSQMSAEQEKALMGNQLTLVGRWHDLVGGRGAAVFESESAEALSAYALNWNKFMDLHIAPVVDDEETKALGRQLNA
jgi:hypothetical protein